MPPTDGFVESYGADAELRVDPPSLSPRAAASYSHQIDPVEKGLGSG